MLLLLNLVRLLWWGVTLFYELNLDISALGQTLFGKGHRVAAALDLLPLVFLLDEQRRLRRSLIALR